MVGPAGLPARAYLGVPEVKGLLLGWYLLIREPFLLQPSRGEVWLFGFKLAEVGGGGRAVPERRRKQPLSAWRREAGVPGRSRQLGASESHLNPSSGCSSIPAECLLSP